MQKRINDLTRSIYNDATHLYILSQLSQLLLKTSLTFSLATLSFMYLPVLLSTAAPAIASQKPEFSAISFWIITLSIQAEFYLLCLVVLWTILICPFVSTYPSQSIAINLLNLSCFTLMRYLPSPSRLSTLAPQERISWNSSSWNLWVILSLCGSFVLGPLAIISGMGHILVLSVLATKTTHAASDSDTASDTTTFLIYLGRFVWCMLVLQIPPPALSYATRVHLSLSIASPETEGLRYPLRFTKGQIEESIAELGWFGAFLFRVCRIGTTGKAQSYIRRETKIHSK